MIIGDVSVSSSNDKPNILIIMTEHQQAQTIEPNSKCSMPNVKDRIVRRGMLFRLGYTPTALCAPARASFFTGLYPTAHGMYNNYHSLPVIHYGLFEDVKLFSEYLRGAGYNLSYIGKWHVSGERGPENYGWRILEGGGPIGYPKPGSRRARWQKQILSNPRVEGLKKYTIIRRRGWPDYILYGTSEGRIEDTIDYRRGRIAIEEIKRLSSMRDPWVIFIGFTEIHDPYIVVEPYASMYDPDDIPLPENYYDSMEDKPAIYRRMREQLWSQLSERQVREAIAHYWGLCSMTDCIVGMILDTLEDEGIEDNTLVVYTSDHGDQVGAHGLFLKGIMPFEESYRVPMAVRWPRIVKPGSTCSEFVTLCDFAPTFCEIAGLDVTVRFHGRSLLPILQGSIPRDWRRSFFGQFLGTEYYYTQRIIRNHRFKYVFNGFDFDELYDLENDPYEMRNLAANPEYEDVKMELIEEMWRWCIKVDDILFDPYPTISLIPYGPRICREIAGGIRY